jgi:DNA-binding transcriptional regulator YiaG
MVEVEGLSAPGAGNRIPICFLCGTCDLGPKNPDGTVAVWYCPTHRSLPSERRSQLAQERINYLKEHPEERARLAAAPSRLISVPSASPPPVLPISPSPAPSTNGQTASNSKISSPSNIKIDWGKHKGKRLGDIDSLWLGWAAGKGCKGVSPGWKRLCKEELRQRGIPVSSAPTDEPSEETSSTTATSTSSTPADRKQDGSYPPAPLANPPQMPTATIHGLRPTLTPADLAKLLKVHKKTVLKWRQEGKLPISIDTLGVRNPRWRVQEIAAWMEAGMPSMVDWEKILARRFAAPRQSPPMEEGSTAIGSDRP